MISFIISISLFGFGFLLGCAFFMEKHWEAQYLYEQLSKWDKIRKFQVPCKSCKKDMKIEHIYNFICNEIFMEENPSDT